MPLSHTRAASRAFLSSLAQDFIEEIDRGGCLSCGTLFLSSLAQDFIEETVTFDEWITQTQIPELSSSGLH